MEEGRPPPQPVFHKLPFRNAVQLNIYAIQPSAVEGGPSLVEAYEKLLLSVIDLPEGFWEEEEARSWHRQSILSLQLPQQFLRMTRGDMTVSNVPLVSGGNGEANCRVFVLSPLLEVDGMHGFLPETSSSPRQKKKKTAAAAEKKDDAAAEEMDLDSWLDAALAAASGDEEEDESPERKRVRHTTAKVNDQGTITVRSATNGRFPLLNDAIMQFNAFVLALDLLARRLIQQDRRMQKSMELAATYHAHVQKNDAYTSSTRYRQSLDELEVEHRKSPIEECKINFKIKGNYILRTTTAPECGIFKAPRLDDIEHLPDAFDVDKFRPSSLQELVECGKNCYVQFMFHPGQLYERYATGRSSDEIYRGMTLRVYRIVFWPTSDRKIPSSVGAGAQNLWRGSMANSTSATTAFYAEASGNVFVQYDEFGFPKTK